MMEQSRHPVDVIAWQTGFADRDGMRRAFRRAFGQPPQVIRRNARAGQRPELRQSRLCQGPAIRRTLDSGNGCADIDFQIRVLAQMPHPARGR